MAPSNLKLQDSQDLFQIDSTGSQSVRQRLQTDARPHPRKGSAKPLKSAQIIAEARGGSSKTKPFVAKHARQREKEAVGYNRDLHAKLQRMVKRKAKSGQGLWGVAQQEGETDAGVVGQQTYDVWSAAAPQEPSSSKGRIFKMPKTLHQHHLLTEGNTPSAINLPHPGQSYNPTATAHSSLIDRAYQSAALEEEQVKKAQALKDRFEGIRKDRKEAWQLAEEDVGSGDEAVEESALDELPAKKVSKRKTDKERRKRIDNIRSEKRAAYDRKLLKSQRHGLSSLPTLVTSLSRTQAARSAAQASKQLALQRKFASSGLESRYLGKARVTPQQPDYQLGEELSESLRGLKAEGNLFKEFQASALRRGLYEATKKRTGESKKKERKTKSVERFDFKRFDK